MTQVLEVLRHRARRDLRPVLREGRRQLDACAVMAAVDAAVTGLRRLSPRAVALLADNGIDWVVSDLAMIACGRALVPLPTFFTRAQMRHAMECAGIDSLIASPALLARTGLRAQATDLRIGELVVYRVDSAPCELPPGTSKITFTSGTTGQPKGVCLAQHTLETVARSLVAASRVGAEGVHLCVLPLATLLENIGGLYAPVLAGACIEVPAAGVIGFDGSSKFDPVRMIAVIAERRASSLILVPELLKALVAALEATATRLPDLRFVAVGGAPIPASWLGRAQAVGLPVFEGYGLSECASVVSLNHAGAVRPGSVGRPLPHVQVRVAQDGEIHVRGSVALGELAHPGAAACDATAPDEVATGDLGHFDGDGYLYITGRRKHQFVTSFGRNVSPEWVERSLCEAPEIVQAAVFGEARPWNAAVLVSDATSSQIDLAVARANRDLPDYARVGRWIRAGQAFTPANGLLTANGRLRRDALQSAYGDALDTLYPTSTESTPS